MLKTLLKNFFSKLFGDTSYKKSFRIYIFLVIIGALLLFSPIALQTGWNFSGYFYTKDNKHYLFFDAIFTAISAFTNTGLTTHTTSKTFSFFGQLIILFLIQFGGIGFLTALIFLWHFLTKTKNINFEHKQLLHFERGNNTRSSAFYIAKTGILMLLTTEIIGAIILTYFFYFYNNSSNTFKNKITDSMWAGIFHSVSASNNAGFDIIGDKSIAPFKNGWGNILSVVLCLQSFIGGIGYPVFYDLYMWYKNKNTNNHYQFTLFTKIAVMMYFFVAILSIYFVLCIEFSAKKWLSHSNLSDWDNNLGNKVWNLIFLTFSARSVGFAGLEINDLQQKTQWIIMILMFVGTSPASTGGGIRTITLFLVIFQIINVILRKKHSSIFKRTIEQKNIYEAMLVFLVAIFLIMFATLFISTQNNSDSFLNIIFEASSAFGTSGLTCGVTQKTNMLGRTILLILMFVGQLGISNALLSCSKKEKKSNQQFAYENIRII